VYNKLDPIKATFQLSRLLSESQSDYECQLRLAMKQIALHVGADQAYMSLWDASQSSIRTIAQWQVEQLDPMPEEPIALGDLSAIDDYFDQNRGMFYLHKEMMFSEHCLLGVLCLESRYLIDRLSQDEQLFIKNAAHMLVPTLREMGVSASLQEVDLPEPAAIHAEPEVSGSADDAPQVLLVEDNKINQLTILKMMQRFGSVVQTADDGLEGIRACQQQKFDLILMDLSMPNLDGFDTTREIITRCPLNKNTPIVAVTANGGKDVESRCLKVGMVEFILKPLRMDRVKELVQKYLKLSV